MEPPPEAPTIGYGEQGEPEECSVTHGSHRWHEYPGHMGTRCAACGKAAPTSAFISMAVLSERERTKFSKWVQFHVQNPQVYTLFVEAVDAWRSNPEHASWHGSAMEILQNQRHNVTVTINGKQREFKFKNDDATYYSRLLMGLLPEVGRGEEKWWRCCEHAKGIHDSTGYCSTCGGLGNRTFGSYRFVNSVHVLREGPFDISGAKIDQRWAQPATALSGPIS